MENTLIKNLFYNSGISMGLTPSAINERGFGEYMRGDSRVSKGYMWNYIHENYFVITECNVVFLEDFNGTFSPKERYITIRLDTAEHISPGKVVMYIEEECKVSKASIKAGTRVRYVDITYFPAFYEKHLSDNFDLKRIDDSPINILMNLGGDHNWPTNMIAILSSINKNTFTGTSGAMFCAAKAYELMSELINMGNSRLPAKSEDYKHILRVIEYMDNSIKDGIRQSDLIKIGGMSGTKLKKVFKLFTGKSITEYILHKRANIASHLLLETDKSIEEIAADIGFDTGTGFATSFKKVIGISPSEYRKRIKIECFQNPSQNESLSFGIKEESEKI